MSNHQIVWNNQFWEDFQTLYSVILQQHPQQMVANRLLQTHLSRSNLGSVRINAFKDRSILSCTSLKPTGPQTRAVTDPSCRFQRADLHLLDQRVFIIYQLGIHSVRERFRLPRSWRCMYYITSSSWELPFSVLTTMSLLGPALALLHEPTPSHRPQSSLHSLSPYSK